MSRRSRTGRGQIHNYLYGEPRDDLGSLFRRLFQRSPARNPENRRPWVEATGDPLKGLKLEKKKRTLFPLGLKRWWRNEPKTIRLLLMAVIGMLACVVTPPIFLAIINGIFALIGRQ